jgi:hypothetical protein
MKIIIILIICLFFSLSITPINEHITNLPTPQTPTAGPPPQTPITGPPPAKQQPQPESGLQTQVNMLSTQITTTNAIAVEAKKKVDEISSQIEQLKEALKKKPDT